MKLILFQVHEYQYPNDQIKQNQPLGNRCVPIYYYLPGTLGQSVASLTADPGVARSILARSHTFVEIDHEIVSTVILLLPLIQEGLVSVSRESMCTKYRLTA